jgi:GTP-binding protein
MAVRGDIRNLAIIAHVDHGKTTLVDAMLRQTGAVARESQLVDRVMDSMDLEKEKGITILAKNTAVTHAGIKFNIIDTPGHADFGGEVERALAMVDGALLLVDASEGPLPQTRFVLTKALEKNLQIILVINKVDRPDARITEVVDEVYELFFELEAKESQIDFPIVYCVARSGTSSLEADATGTDLVPLFRLMAEHIPAPTYQDTGQLQTLVTNLDASTHLGRLAICRVVEGEIYHGQPVAHCKRDGSVAAARITQLWVTEGLERVMVQSASPGDIITVAGIEGITIGETLADPDAPVPLPGIDIDEPTMSITLGINTSPLAGRDGKKLTSRLLRNRLEAEVIGNVSIKVSQAEKMDGWVIQGRGELQLAVLIETMRREGFELTVGRPEVLTKKVDGVLLEPIDSVFVEVPQEFVGAVSQSIALRKGQMRNMVNHKNGGAHLEFAAPVRGLIGFQTEFLSCTSGTGIMNRTFARFEPWLGEIRTRATGSLVADRAGSSTGHALFRLQERGKMFVPPGIQVYEGMIVGENARSDDMDVNPTREKKLTNMRAAGSDSAENLTPYTRLSLEQTLAFLSADECAEVTPLSIRMRKVILGGLTRSRQSKKAARI